MGCWAGGPTKKIPLVSKKRNDLLLLQEKQFHILSSDVVKVESACVSNVNPTSKTSKLFLTVTIEHAPHFEQQHRNTCHSGHFPRPRWRIPPREYACKQITAHIPRNMLREIKVQIVRWHQEVEAERLELSPHCIFSRLLWTYSSPLRQ